MQRIGHWGAKPSPLNVYPIGHQMKKLASLALASRPRTQPHFRFLPRGAGSEAAPQHTYCTYRSFLPFKHKEGGGGRGGLCAKQ